MVRYRPGADAGGLSAARPKADVRHRRSSGETDQLRTVSDASLSEDENHSEPADRLPACGSAGTAVKQNW